jgi:hypothetical protein
MQWLHFLDEKVTSVLNDKDIVSKDACLLFYETIE